MIIKKNILKTLTDLDRKYNQSLISPNPNDSIFFSKLAVLEYCGWIEHCFDEIVLRSVQSKLKTQRFKDVLRERVVGNNHGFEYKKHFRPMMLQAIGIVKMEALEFELDVSGQLPVLVSELDNVKTERDSAAHTYSENLLITYSSPSVTIQRFKRIFPIVKHTYSYIVNKI
ncbi:hypothetical protein [Methylotenera sp. N17]|uniref:hypothetical protein n=1 Tax=Methylotenera sp. N17 TaxID=1502761 RepID=UPI0006484488|nr:hypothetical protein [Methylotenera sp. N17]